MFFNRLMGASEANQGEIITKVQDNLWQSNRGTLYRMVEPDLCQSSTGVYYRKTGLNVYGSDGHWFSSLDVFDNPPSAVSDKKQAEYENNVKTGAIGCLKVIALLAAVVVFLGVR